MGRSLRVGLSRMCMYVGTKLVDVRARQVWRSAGRKERL